MPPRAPRDALVIGGGPAGAVVATLLARHGVRVRLLEAVTYPRDKVCGECLSALGVEILRRHDLTSAIECHKPLPLGQTSLISIKGRSTTFPLPAEMWGISRAVMDTALLDAARESGVDVRQPARVLRVIPGDRPRIAFRERGREQEADADVVLLADGKGTLAGAFAPPSPRPTGDFGVKAHFANVALPTTDITLFGLRRHYVGLAPVASEADLVWNLACNVPAARLRTLGGDHSALLEVMQRDNPTLKRVLSGATRVSDWKSSPLPRFSPRQAHRWPAGVVPVGNAAAALEPIGGEGMGLAIASAELAAKALLERAPLDHLAHAYDQLWRIRRPACRAMALLLSHPWLGGATVTMAQALPPIRQVGLMLTGKHFASTRAAVW